MHEKNTSKFSKCEPCHKHKQEPQVAARHKPYLKDMYKAYTFLLMDLMILLMDNCNMAMLSMDLESRSSLFTTIAVSTLIQLAVGILLDTRNAATASKPNVAHVTIVLK